MGIKTPLINMRGNLRTFESNIIFPGKSVGNFESRLPTAEKQMADKTMVMVKTTGLIMFNPRAKTPKERGRKQTDIP